MAVTETWINIYTPVNMLQVTTYTFIHVDRDNKNGGGVGFYIHSSISFKKRTDLMSSTSRFEYLFIELTRLGRSIVGGVIYRPPDSSISTFIDDFTDVLNLIQ